MGQEAEAGGLGLRGREGHWQGHGVRKRRQKDRWRVRGVQPEPGGDGGTSGLVTGGRKAMESKEKGVNLGRGEPCGFGRDRAQTQPGFVRQKTIP